MKSESANAVNRQSTNNIIIARDEPLSLIEKEFDNLLMGDFGLSIIAGEAGVGKTYLVNQSENLFLSNNCTYIKAKFNQYHEDIFTPMISIIEDLLNHIFTLDQSSFSRIQKIVTSSLQTHSHTISALCPKAEKIFGKKSKETTMDLNENKISQAIFLMLKAVSKVLFPLVIFIDDLHWADRISMNVIKRICDERNLINIHLILAYREQENRSVDSLLDFYRYKKIKLNQFGIDDIREYLAMSFTLDAEKMSDLSQLIYNLTKGNPFYLNIIVNQMKSNYVIEEDSNTWVIDFNKFGSLELSKDMKKVLLEEIQELSKDEIKILQLISCFGGHVEHEILNLFFRNSKIPFEKQLEKIFEKSLLVQHSVESQIKYSFVHDIVYDVIYQTQDERKKTDTYYDIACTLQKFGYSEKKPLFTASFLMKSDQERILKEEKPEWIDILARAGKIAQDRGNIEYALRIFERCDELATASAVKPDREFYLDMQLAYLQCRFVNEREAEAQRHYEQLMKGFSDQESVIKIKLKYIYYYAYNANWEKVLSLGTDILKYLNFDFNTRSIPLDLIKSRMLYSRKKIEGIKDAPVITDYRLLTILEVLVIMFPAANRLDLKLFTLVTLKLAILSGKYGNSKYSCIGYASYCYLLFFMFRDYKKGDRLQKITLELLDHPDMDSTRTVAYAIIGTFTYHWTNTFDKTLECLQKSIDFGTEEGEYLYSNYAIVFSMITKYVKGSSLSEIENDINFQRRRKDRLENYLTRHMYEIYLSQIAFFKTGKFHYSNRIDEQKQSFYDTIKLNADMIKVHRLLLDRNFRQAFEQSKLIEPLVENHKGFVLNGHFAFYSTLARIAAHHSLNENEKRVNKRAIKKKISSLRKWANVFPNHHSARYLLAKAQFDFVIENKRNTNENDYFLAIKKAKEENNIQLEAFANLLTARRYRHNSRLAEFYAKEAADLYKKWGAAYIAKVIRKEFDVKSKSVSAGKQLVKEARSEELLEELNSIGDLSEEESYLYMLNYLVDYDYTENCYIFIEKKGDMYLKYSKKQNEAAVKQDEPVNINYIDDISHKIVRYVSRTEASVFLTENEPKEFFKNDVSYSGKENNNIICMPIKRFDILTGIVYLELNREISSKNTKNAVQLFLSLLSAKSQLKGNGYKDKKQKKNNKNLTAREIGILELISLGMSNSQISEKLFIAEGTVRNHLSNVYSKLGVDNRMQAIIEAKENHII